MSIFVSGFLGLSGTLNPEEPKNYYDFTITGFIIDVRATGGKTYALRYKGQHGKQIRHKIGDAKSITFDKARNAAKVLRAQVVLGDSPSEKRKTKKVVSMLSEFSRERYIPFVKSYKCS